MASKYDIGVSKILKYYSSLLDINDYYHLTDIPYSDLFDVAFLLKKITEIFKKNGFPKIDEDFFVWAEDYAPMNEIADLYAQAEIVGLQAGLIKLYREEIEEYIWKHMNDFWDKFIKVGDTKFEIDDSDPDYPEGVFTYVVKNVSAFKKLLAEYYESDFEWLEQEFCEDIYDAIDKADRDMQDYMANLRNEWFYADDKVMYEELEYLLKDFIAENKAELKKLYSQWLNTLDKNV